MREGGKKNSKAEGDHAPIIAPAIDAFLADGMVLLLFEVVATKPQFVAVHLGALDDSAHSAVQLDVIRLPEAPVHCALRLGQVAHSFVGRSLTKASIDIHEIRHLIHPHIPHFSSASGITLRSPH